MIRVARQVPTSAALTSGIRRLLERDPASRILDQLELVQGKADLATLRKVIRRTSRRVETGWLHVSDMQIPCDRLLAAALLGIPAPRSFIPPRTRRIFDNGTYTHLRFQSYFYHLPKPFVVEAPKLLKLWPIIGEADIVVRHPEIGDWVLELKTINSTAWRGLVRPQDSHIAQLNCYLGLSGRSWAGQVWYENKNDQELKLFVQAQDKFEWERVWLRASEVAYRLLAVEKLPPSCQACLDSEFCDSLAATKAMLEVLDGHRTSADRC